MQSALAARLLELDSNPREIASAQLIDSKALAARLGVHESFVRTEARAGRIPFVRVGRYVRFDPRAVSALSQAK